LIAALEPMPQMLVDAETRDDLRTCGVQEELEVVRRVLDVYSPQPHRLVARRVESVDCFAEPDAGMAVPPGTLLAHSIDLVEMSCRQRAVIHPEPGAGQQRFPTPGE